MSNRKKEADDLHQKQLSKTDRKLFNYYKDTIRGLKLEVKNFLDDYDNLSASQKWTTNRKQQAMITIGKILTEMTEKTQPEIEKFLTESAKDGYLASMYELEGKAGVTLDFHMPNQRYIEKLVHEPVKGTSFSQRLYGNRNQLGEVVTSQLLEGANNGTGYREIAKNIAELTEADYKQSLTIVRTESGRVQSETTQKSFEDAEDLGVQLQKMWIGSGDSRDDHQDADGQVVDIDEEFEVGGDYAMAPGLFGKAEQDINCGCTMITIVNGVAPSLRRQKDVGVVNFEDWKNDKGE